MSTKAEVSSNVDASMLRNSGLLARSANIHVPQTEQRVIVTLSPDSAVRQNLNASPLKTSNPFVLTVKAVENELPVNLWQDLQ